MLSFDSLVALVEQNFWELETVRPGLTSPRTITCATQTVALRQVASIDDAMSLLREIIESEIELPRELQSRIGFGALIALIEGAVSSYLHVSGDPKLVAEDVCRRAKYWGEGNLARP